MARLLACPFCRELYTQGEVEICPQCDLPVRDLADLPASAESLDEELAVWQRLAPADRPLPWFYWQRARGLLLLLAACGLGAFCSPWVEMTLPDITTLSGFRLAQARGFWFAGGAVGWAVMFALVSTRRSVNQMRGVRLVAALLASVTFFQTVVLVLNPPNQSFIPLRYSWAWGLYASALLSLVAIPVALVFGGRVDELPSDLGRKYEPGEPKENSKGHTLH